MRRVVQIATFVVATHGHLAFGAYDFASPTMSGVVATAAAVIAFALLLLVATQRPLAPRMWRYLAVGFAIAGGTSGIAYRAEYDGHVIEWSGDHARHVVGDELTPAGERRVHETPARGSRNDLLSYASGVEDRVWTPKSLARARAMLTALYLGFVLCLAAAVFAAVEQLSNSQTQQSRLVILFIAANPEGTSQLRLDKECAAIEQELHLADASKRFDFRSKWAATADDVMRSLNTLQPAILHFSGHGGEVGGSAAPPVGVTLRDVTASAGDRGGALALEDEAGAAQYVPPSALAQMIRTASPATRLVVLNACYSAELGTAVAASVDCVVGMSGAIADTAARAFAIGFYRALGHGRTIGNAVAQAVASLEALQLPDAQLPHLTARAGVDADSLVL